MLLSRFWYGILAIALGVSVFILFVAVQMYNRAIVPTMWARLRSGQTVKQATDWATHEIEGFIRN